MHQEFVILEGSEHGTVVKEPIEHIAAFRIGIWDNGGETFDRYTIAYLDTDESRNQDGSQIMMVGSSINPDHPQGFWQHVSGYPGDHLGTPIYFDDLPDLVQRALISEIFDDAEFLDFSRDLWWKTDSV